MLANSEAVCEIERSVEDDLCVGTQEAEEATHSVGLDLTSGSGVEVAEGLVEVFVHAVFACPKRALNTS